MTTAAEKGGTDPDGPAVPAHRQDVACSWVEAMERGDMDTVEALVRIDRTLRRQPTPGRTTLLGT